MKAEIMTITPEMAAKMLEGNVKNRPLSQSRVEHIAKSIQRGEWECNGETIILNGTRLLDGQHRLAGCVFAGVPITSFVVQGAEDKVFHTIDSGVSRTAGDVLSMAGVTNARNVVASLRWVQKYNTGRVPAKVVYTTPQLEQMLADHPGIVRSVSVTKDNRIANPAVLGACHYLFSKLDNDGADLFMKQLKDGADLSSGDGVFMLRERLLAEKMSKRRLSQVHIFALVIKGWNARRAGTTVTTANLRWREGGPVPEAFPVIK